MSTLEHSVRRIAAVGAVALFVPVAPAAAATVVRVIDGDTVKVRDDGKLRTVDLAGVNAPEPGACAGPEARRGLARLLREGPRLRGREWLAFMRRACQVGALPYHCDQPCRRAKELRKRP